METKDKETLGLKSIIVGYIRKWRVFLGAFVISLLIAILYLVLIPRTFEIMSRIQVQETDGSGGSFGLGEAAGLMKSFGIGGGGGAGSVNIEDEMAILTSTQLLKQTIYALGMNVEYFKPKAYSYKMYDDSPLLLTADSLTFEKLYDEIRLTVEIGEDGKGSVKVSSREDGKQYNFTFTSLPVELKLNQGAFVLSYRDMPLQAAYKMKIIVKPASWVAEEIVDRMLVEDLSKSSNTLELTYPDYKRPRGIDFLNTLIRFYNEQDELLKRQESEKSLAFVNDRMLNVSEELKKTELEIEKFKTLHNMTDIEYDVQFYISQMQDIQIKLIELQTEIQVIHMLDDYVKDPANRYNLVPMLLSAKDGESGGAIAAYNEKLLERSQLLKSAKLENPLIGQLTGQVDQLRESVKATIANARSGLNFVIDDLHNKETLIYEKMGEVPSLEREYIEYKRQQEIYQGVYLLLLQKREDIALAQGELKPRSRVIDTAFVKKKSIAPRKLYAAIFIFLFTLLVPVLYLAMKNVMVDLIKELKKDTV
ncbi:tyrosine-protein kinase Etk/Wzc [Parabacteroides sp. PFB2-10]|uniref:GumC family protein n=1 Tax=Parabacteroides sp. PFB2-10 TaxID=1742405 RepID=UPI002473A473|nr:tyrosine protein kinase [Parabacteroides sp. PFB2-10]MDH6313534.1 tyrosine-protein kinase Etk/Wzc [Parabacteroides sp. PFB2-10]